MRIEQLAFDFDALMAEDAPPKPGYTGRAPLEFTTDYFTPDEIAEAWAEAVERRGDTWPRRYQLHGWHTGFLDGFVNDQTLGHSFYLVSAELRCDCKFDYRVVADYIDAGRCTCLGSLLYQANCEECRWHAIGGENDVVEAWHDHAWPGWRDLPALPHEHGAHDGAKWSKKAAAWIAANQPAEWQVPGAPIRTWRTPMGTRHVNRRSPWGGYDLSAGVES